ncbi:MAG TPA: CocE/NonD family hydrolase [Gammaproteobacteria bacterium]|nr:CocE/NonD family hydrolase [Gammaproteobacteria bacterium]
MSRHCLRLLSPGLIAVLMFAAGTAQAAAPNLNQGVVSDLQQMIPLHDGVHLAATVWRPLDQAKPLPVVLMITPYVSDETHNRAVKWVQGGYVYVVVDVRGRGDSEGVFRPLYGGGPDGAEVVEWLAQQPWCDGRVATLGGSYRGMVQWEILAQHPKHLVALMPTAAVYPGYDFPNWKGVMPSYTAQWLALTSGHTAHDQLFGDGDYWNTQFARLYKSGAAFTTLAPLAAGNRPAFEEWMQHHDYDAYWAAYNPDPREYAKVNIPILAITGYFDGDQPGEMRYYREFSQNAPAAELARLTLLMGPWDHPGTRYPQKQLGGLTFPDNSVLDIDHLQISWLDWVLKGGKRPEMLSDRVNYYVMGEGAEQWRHVASLEALTDHVQKLYLSSVDGPAGDVFHSGRLVAAVPQDTSTDSFRSDPNSQDGLPTNDGSNFLTDQSSSFQKNTLVYQSDPLTAPATIAGYVRFTGSFSLDTPDADIGAEVDAVLPDGRTLVLGTDLVRARYRRGMSRAAPVTPGEIEPYAFDGFYLTDQHLPAGTRIRLLLTSVNTPFLERNDNSGGALGVEPTNHGRVATVSVHLDAAHPSYLELPLAKD